MAPVKKTPIEIVPGMAEAIEARRTKLGVDLVALVDATGLSRPGLAHIRNGERRKYQDRLKFPLCRALKWTPDSIDRLLRGQPPVPLDDDEVSSPGGQPDLARVERKVDELIELVLQLSQRLATPDDDVEQIPPESRTAE